MKYFETFAGVEGIGLGLPKKWQCIGLSEWDKYASMVLKYHNPNITNYGDISSINWKQVPDFDLLTGGSPCQDFSIAGKRRGLAGAKSSLAWEFIRALREKQPGHFIWENVKGVLSSRGGWDFANLISAFSESGYDLWWQVLNAKDFGVPQNRERIFVIGTRSDIGSPKEVLFVRENESLYPESNALEEEVHDIAQTITTQSGMNATGSYIASTMTARQYASWGGNFIQQLNNPSHSNNRLYSPEGLSPTLNTMKGGNRQSKIRITKDGFHHARGDKKHSSVQGTHVTFEEGKSHALGTAHTPMVLIPEATKKGYGEATVGDSINLSVLGSSTRRGRVGKGVAQTLDTGMQQHTLTEDMNIRRLMPIECERLMSWPDNHTKFGINDKGEKVEVSDSQRYIMCGNGVVSECIKALVDNVIPHAHS